MDTGSSQATPVGHCWRMTYGLLPEAQVPPTSRTLRIPSDMTVMQAATPAAPMRLPSSLKTLAGVTPSPPPPPVARHGGSLNGPSAPRP